MTVKLAFEVDDDGSRAIQEQVNVQVQDGVRDESVPFEEYYALQYTAEQLLTNGFRCIALQFPDSLLTDAPRVQQELMNRLGGEYDRVFVLGDTSYGSCCVDEVAAQHLYADCVVHYGRTCLSATSQLPVIYVFGNSPVDTGDCVNKLAPTIEEMDKEKTLLLLCEPCYYHAMSDISSLLQDRYPNRHISTCYMPQFYNPKDPSHNEDANTPKTVIGGQEFPIESENNELDPEKYALVYIGGESEHLTSVLLRMSSFDCFSYNPVGKRLRKEGATVNRALMRRFFLMQQAKEAEIIGILMGTLGVSKYLDVVQSLKKLIHKSGRKSYMFVVGKINIPKLANFAEIDAFVLVACQQNTLMDSKEFFKPIVTPYELQMALSPDEETAWTGQYKTDFGEVLPAIEQTSAELETQEGNPDSDKPFFSLVTGAYKSTRNAHNDTGEVLAIEGEKGDALQVRDQEGQLTKYRSEAAEFLKTREYQGLDPRIGESKAHAAVAGSKGIAKGYTQEEE